MQRLSISLSLFRQPAWGAGRPAGHLLSGVVCCWSTSAMADSLSVREQPSRGVAGEKNCAAKTDLRVMLISASEERF